MVWFDPWFSLVITGCFHGFASWFEVVFGGFDLPMGEEHIKLCTGPDNQLVIFPVDFDIRS